MKAEDLLKSGNLAEALADLQAAIRKAPGDARLRIFLFQLLCVTGDWTRALAQLKLCAELDPAANTMAQTYREAIGCELLRDRVFAGEATPLVFGQPAEWVAILIEALKPLAAGETARASELRARAFDAAPATTGRVDGVACAWIADADMRIGPMTELILNGKYYWAPWSAIHQMKIEPPKDLRDHVWTPVEITWSNGGVTVGFVPTRYPGAARATQDALKLGRLTDWTDLGSETFAGSGQRLIATDAGEYGLMDIRLIELDTLVEEAPEAEAAEDG